jgi:small-conductance mechanosensitive channel
VEDITLRHTVIRDFENRRVVIPNSIISDEVILNSDMEDGRVIKWIDVGISYESDVDLAKEILQELGENHPLSIDGRTPEQLELGLPKVMVRVIGLGEYSVNLRAWVWTKDNADAFALGCDVFEQVHARYKEAGIEIPYPHRTLVQK